MHVLKGGRDIDRPNIMYHRYKLHTVSMQQYPLILFHVDSE